MEEFFFVLTVIYGLYVISVTLKDNQKAKVIDDSATAMMSLQPVKPLIPENIKTQPLIKSRTIKTIEIKIGLKNPETGEIVTSYSNYRFVKRWIKEALVKEGLLDKIYKNNELNKESELKIKQALEQLEQLSPYQV